MAGDDAGAQEAAGAFLDAIGYGSVEAAAPQLALPEAASTAWAVAPLIWLFSAG